MRNRARRLVEHLLGCHAQLVLHVGFAGGDERVDAMLLGRFDRLPTTVDVFERRTGQSTDDRAANRFGDREHRLEIALTGNGKAGLDVVDAETSELVRDLELLAHIERDTGRLLTVSQRRIEDHNSLA